MEPRKEEIYGYVKVVKEERRDPEALHRGLQRGLGIKHPERILGYAGLFFDTGDVYASREVAEHMTRYPGFSATILEILKRFSKEDYGEVSDSVVQDNGESRWLSGGRFLYGRYGCGKGHDDPERFHVNIRVRKHWDHTFVTYESEPDWFLFLKDEDLPALEDRSAQIRSKALETLDDGNGFEYGNILRAKGILPTNDGRWLHFDYVPGEYDVRYGAADYTGRLCVIGCKINQPAIRELFGI